MTVRYVRVNPIVDLFSPAVRSFGDVAIIGEATAGTANSPVAFTNPAAAKTMFPGNLGDSIAVAFRQSPGPSLVYGVRTANGPDWAAALNVVAALDVQIIALACIPLNAATAANNGAIFLLAEHVATVSNTGGDGKERIGVAMLPAGISDPAIVTGGTLAHERMVYIAHNSTKDAAAAVAGTIAGYEPHISLLLKPVNITSAPFTPAEILTLNGSESNFNSPPKGQGVNWLVDPALIPGAGVYMGEGYTGNPGGKKFIDIVRTVDDISFRLKAQMIRSIGNLRISRSGLRAMIAQMEAVLTPLVRSEVIENFFVFVPILTLLDKDPSTLTAGEIAEINQAQSNRLVEVLVEVDYAGAIHRLAINLKFE